MSQSTSNPLFQPFRLKSLELKNRIVMAPMTRSFSPEGIPGSNVADYYRRRAEADVGLILSEGTGVKRTASLNDPNVPHFYGDEALAGWKKVIDGVHAAGGRMAPQLWHVGGARNGRTTWLPEGDLEGPSGVTASGKPNGRKMTEEDVADTVAAFATAAADAKRLGFDAAEIHGAHGYLIDQFFWSQTNRRDDINGGATLQERSRFAIDIVKAIRAAVGPDYPVILRLSQWKQQDFSARLAQTPDEMAAWLLPLVEAGADALHCSQRRFWEPEFPEIDGEKGLNFAGWAKKLTGTTTISVGSVGLSGEFIAAFGGETSQPASLDELNRRMEAEEFDLIAVGRALISDPQWVAKLKAGEALSGFNPAALGTLY
jgi:2,4-dienoyl-CoA reductase-like NADH-dependent reductase (Old Yellow Enzyme family)